MKAQKLFPTISAAILCYNHAKYIVPALKSILEQDYEGEYDVVIADDTSTDNSQKVIAEFLENHPKKEQVTFIAREINMGLIRNAQHAVSLTKGDYIITCGRDDINRAGVSAKYCA